MQLISLKSAIGIYFFLLSTCNSTRIRKKSTIEIQGDIFKGIFHWIPDVYYFCIDIATSLKQESKKLPTQESVIEKIERIDNEEFQKLDKREADEIKDLNSNHTTCEEAAYERDYTFACPAGWNLQPDGSCWGESYKGVCEARQNFKFFTSENKRQTELKCCIFWPRKTAENEKELIMHAAAALHGTISPTDGTILVARQ
ncbi:CPW-WPC domain [Babesia duncani]|uniref:CPW-WPC domain n=1 Tax=Babesia duncani TaxID=323732 RepID=A0AAD9PLT2_9APIC|nr:CPW-WPC domain [Babesia duncani]